MSKTVTCNKDIEIQIDHVKCSYCGDELSFSATTDKFGDIQIIVDKCKCEDE